MSSPFYQPFFPQQQAQVEDPAVCDYCGEILEEGEQALELFDGVIGRGQKSGRLMVTESLVNKDDMNVATLHRECAPTFIYHMLIGDEMPEPLCSVCESKLDGD